MYDFEDLYFGKSEWKNRKNCFKGLKVGFLSEFFLFGGEKAPARKFRRLQYTQKMVDVF